MLQILGRHTSGNVMLPMWVCDELSIPYEQTDIGGPYGGNDRPEYRARNPNGLVPTIVDGDFVLWESNAIVRYLCAKHSMGTLCPTDPQQRALAEQWMDWKLSSIVPMITPIFIGYVRTKPEDRDMRAIERSIKWGIQLWSLLDRHLANCPYLLGDNFTMADIPFGPQLHRWLLLVKENERPAMPNLQSWYQRFTQRPVFVRHCMNPLV